LVVLNYIFIRHEEYKGFSDLMAKVNPEAFLLCFLPTLIFDAA
jgi:hypothetical protein